MPKLDLSLQSSFMRQSSNTFNSGARSGIGSGPSASEGFPWRWILGGLAVVGLGFAAWAYMKGRR